MNNAHTGANLSSDRKYRYKLWRSWDYKLPRVTWIMLNPSTANEKKDDATIRKCISYAKSWGYGGIAVCNLFAYRSKSREVMKKYRLPIGDLNNGYILEAARNSGVVVCGWGTDGPHLGRASDVLGMLEYKGIETHALRLTKSGEPYHPLYQKGSLRPRLISELREEQEKGND